MPIRLVINTRARSCYILLKGLGKADILFDDKEVIRIQLKNWLIRQEFFPLRRTKRNYQLPDKNATNPKKIPPAFKDKTRVKRFIKSFRVRRFYLNIDTGDPVLNSKLFPICALANYFNTNINVNFMGDNVLILIIENRPIRIIKSFINI